MILRLILIFITAFIFVFASWGFFWPQYEWVVGIRPLWSFMNQNQMMFFGLGAIGFFGSIYMGKKIMLG